MDKSLDRIRVPRELDHLSEERSGVQQPRQRRDESRRSSKPALTPTASHRLRQLTQAERDSSELSVAHPAWLDGLAVPRLIVSARYVGQDAFGSSRLLADLDLAARRAGAIQRQLIRGNEIHRLPDSLRTHDAGLRLLDARLGSFEVLLTVWGSLVAIAGSSPVAVAGLMALSWDMGRGVLRQADRWVGAVLGEEQREQPTLVAPVAGEPWGVQHTKVLAPVMRDVVANDQGFELFLDEKERQIKLTVLPNDRT